MRSTVAGLLVALMLAGCGAAQEGEREVLGTESPEPTYDPAPYVKRDADLCSALPADARKVSDAVAESDRAELAETLDDGKGVRSVGITSCGDVTVIRIGLASSMVSFPATGTGGTPVITQQQPPINAR